MPTSPATQPKQQCFDFLFPLLPTPPAGLYKAWAVINGRMTAVPLHIPRTFYVDATAAPGSDGGWGPGELGPRSTAGGRDGLLQFALGSANASAISACPCCHPLSPAHPPCPSERRGGGRRAGRHREAHAAGGRRADAHVPGTCRIACQTGLVNLFGLHALTALGSWRHCSPSPPCLPVCSHPPPSPAPPPPSPVPPCPLPPPHPRRSPSLRQSTGVSCRSCRRGWRRRACAARGRSACRPSSTRRCR